VVDPIGGEADMSGMAGGGSDGSWPKSSAAAGPRFGGDAAAAGLDGGPAE